MSFNKRHKSNSKQYIRGGYYPLLAPIVAEMENRYGRIIGVKSGKNTCHHPACPSMLRGKNIKKLTFVDCTRYDDLGWKSLVDASIRCCSSLWIGTIVCMASLEE